MSQTHIEKLNKIYVSIMGLLYSDSALGICLQPRIRYRRHTKSDRFIGTSKCFHRIHRRGDSRWEGYRGSNEICFLGSADYRGRTMREGSAKKYSNGKSRNGRTNTNVEGQRSNAGDEGET